jgi:hypothetical protein
MAENKFEKIKINCPNCQLPSLEYIGHDHGWDYPDPIRIYLECVSCKQTKQYYLEFKKYEKFNQ